jgi:hypothetical protein
MPKVKPIQPVELDRRLPYRDFGATSPKSTFINR